MVAEVGGQWCSHWKQARGPLTLRRLTGTTTQGRRVERKRVENEKEKKKKKKG